MKISAEPITRQSAGAVLEGLCAVHLAEMSHNSEHPSEILPRILDHVRLGTGAGVVATIDGNPAALFFHWKEDSGRRIFFVATQRLFDAKVQGVLACRKYLKALQSEQQCVFRAVNRAEHPSMARWLSLLGFREEAPDHGARIFTLGRV